MILSKLNLFLFIYGLNLICFCFGVGPEPEVGLCPEKETVDNFDIDRFLGLWYINSRYPFLDEIVPNCVTQNYTKINNEYSLQERATILPRSANKTIQRGILEVPIRQITNKGHFVMYTKGANEIAEISVLDTDYKNYAILYTCINFENMFHYVSGVITTRFAKPSVEIMELANDTLTMNGISLEKMTTISHDVC